MLGREEEQFARELIGSVFPDESEIFRAYVRKRRETEPQLAGLYQAIDVLDSRIAEQSRVLYHSTYTHIVYRDSPSYRMEVLEEAKETILEIIELGLDESLDSALDAIEEMREVNLSEEVPDDTNELEVRESVDEGIDMEYLKLVFDGFEIAEKVIRETEF